MNLSDVCLDRKGLYSALSEYRLNKDYLSIYVLYNEIYKYNDTKLYDILYEAMFYLKYYDKCILDILSLHKNDVESFVLLYYFILSCLASNDIFMAYSLINKYKLLDDNKTKEYLESDNCSLLNLKDEDRDYSLCLILVLFVLNNKECKELMVNFFDLISRLYEIGYSEEIVNLMTNIGHIIYNI